MIYIIIAVTIGFSIAHMIRHSFWFQKWLLLRKLRKCNFSNFARIDPDGHAYGYDTVPARVFYDCRQPARYFGYYPALAGRIFKK